MREAPGRERRDPPIRGVIFDLGNVLIRLRTIPLPTGAGPRELELAGESPDPLALLRLDPVLDRFERGQATEGEFFQAVRRLFQVELPDPDIRAAYFAVLSDPVPGMAELVQDLRARDVRTVGLTDISAGHLALVGRYPAVKALDGLVASCETGHRKPEPAAYRAALAAICTRPEETFFVDDRHENVAGAAAMGIRGMVFTSPEALRGRLGLLP